MPSWDDLQRKPAAEIAAPSELDEACAAALTTPSGRRLMEVLYKLHIDAVPAGLPDERALLANHVRRQFVRQLEIATARGLAARAKKTTKDK